MMKINFILALVALVLFGCGEDALETDHERSGHQEEVIEKYLRQGAWKHNYLTKEWDEWINKGIQEDSTIAYLWQQKALPMWKQRKYSLAITYYDKAVKYDRRRWLSRLGFLKCIFAKDYPAALSDLISYKNEFGSTLEQDHSLEFYIALCYLQLAQYEKAFTLLDESVRNDQVRYGVEGVHYLDRLYLAISLYELGQYEKAIANLNIVLKEYPNFSDAQFYKAMCLNYTGKTEEAKSLMSIAKQSFQRGRSFNEDSSKYEVYPYQLTWQWNIVETLLH